MFTWLVRSILLFCFPGREFLNYLQEKYPSDIPDSFSLTRMVSLAEGVMRGFIQPACSLDNSKGKYSFMCLVNMCVEILDNVGYDFPNNIDVEPTGTGYYVPSVKMNVYTIIDKQMYEDYKSGKIQWPPKEDVNDVHVVGETKSPDVQCLTHRFGHTHERCLMVAEVKSGAELKKGDLRQLFQQTWKEALLGLEDTNVSHAILYQPEGVDIIRLEIQEFETEDKGKVQRLVTYNKSLNLLHLDGTAFLNFNVDSIIELLKKVVAICFLGLFEK